MRAPAHRPGLLIYVNEASEQTWVDGPPMIKPVPWRLALTLRGAGEADPDGKGRIGQGFGIFEFARSWVGADALTFQSQAVG
jgi:hypothetical protein